MIRVADFPQRCGFWIRVLAALVDLVCVVAIVSTFALACRALGMVATAEQWQQYGMHSERGRETIEQIVRLTAGHDLNHLKQIERILRVGATSRSR